MPKKGYSNLDVGNLNEDLDDIPFVQKKNWCLVPCCKVPRIGCFFIFLVVLVIVVVIGYFLVLPAVVQGFVNGSTLGFSRVEIQQPQNSSFTLSASASLENVGPFSCTVDAMDVQVYYQNTKLGSTSMPTLSIESGKKTTIDIVEEFNIENMTLFESYSKELLYATEGVIWNLKGTTTVTALGFHITVKFDKDVSLNGMGGLSNVTILGFNLPRNAPGGGVEIELNITQINPSIVGIEIGDFSLTMLFNDSYMGQVNAKNITVVPGSNFLHLSGFIKPDDLDLASQFFSQYIEGIDSPVRCTGLSASEDSPEWIKYMVSLLDVRTIMEGSKNLTLMKDISITSLDMNFQSNTDLKNGATTFSYFVNPFGFPLEIYEVAMIMDMYYEDTLIANQSVPFTPVLVNLTTGLISLNFSDIPLQVQNVQIFSDFATQLILLPSAVLGIHVRASSRIGTAMGNLTLGGIQIKQTITVPGMDSFKNPPTLVPSTDIISATASSLELTFDIWIYNPSFVTFASPSLPVSIYYSGLWLGNSTVAPLTLNRQSLNKFSAKGHIYKNATNENAINLFFSEYTKGHNSSIYIRGIPEDIDIVVLKQALASLNSSATAFGMTENLISSVHMQWAWDMIRFIVPTSIYANNPYSTQMVITGINAKIYTTHDMTWIAELNEDISNSPVILPPNSTTFSPPQPVNLVTIDWDVIKSLFGSILISVIGQFNITVGNPSNGFTTSIQFQEDWIPAQFDY